MSVKHFIKGKSFRPTGNNVFVTDLEQGERLTKGGLLIPDDNMTDRGIRDRWARVWAKGPDVTDVDVGEWVLVKHGRWTTGIEMKLDSENLTVWRIEFPDAVMLVSDTDPRNSNEPVTFRTYFNGHSEHRHVKI